MFNCSQMKDVKQILLQFQTKFELDIQKHITFVTSLLGNKPCHSPTLVKYSIKLNNRGSIIQLIKA